MLQPISAAADKLCLHASRSVLQQPLEPASTSCSASKDDPAWQSCSNTDRQKSTVTKWLMQISSLWFRTFTLSALLSQTIADTDLYLFPLWRFVPLIFFCVLSFPSRFWKLLCSIYAERLSIVSRNNSLHSHRSYIPWFKHFNNKK